MNRDYLLEIINHNISLIASKTDDYCFLNNQSKEAFDLEIEIAGLFSTSMWIQNNLDISSIEEYSSRVSSFEELLNDKRYLALCEHLKEIGNRYYDLEYKDYSMEDRNIFLTDLVSIQEMLSESTIQEKEQKCHFQLFSKGIDRHSDMIDTLKVVLANQNCLFQLKEIEKSFLNEKESKKY